MRNNVIKTLSEIGTLLFLFVIEFGIYFIVPILTMAFLYITNNL